MNIGSFEIIVILILVLILYGKRLPEITRALGKAYREFRKNIDDVKRDFQEQIENIADAPMGPPRDARPVRDETKEGFTLKELPQGVVHLEGLPDYPEESENKSKNEPPNLAG
jgi:sec-independent protein translocase protein TatA